VRRRSGKMEAESPIKNPQKNLTISLEIIIFFTVLWVVERPLN